MSLKRRNILAVVFLLLAAASWTVGQMLITGIAESNPISTTNVSNEVLNTTAPTLEAFLGVTVPSYRNTEPASTPTMSSSDLNTGNSTERYPNAKKLGFLLSFLGVIFAAVGVFALRQTEPLLGPDGAVLILAPIGLIRANLQTSILHNGIWLYALITLLVLFILRELWGWLLARFSLSWCSIQRLSNRFSALQYALLLMTAWTIFLTVCLVCLLLLTPARTLILTLGCLLFCIALNICCIWKYGADLLHFRKQLENFRQGKPITIHAGSFADTESLLLDIQAAHKDAVQAAITSERFKVELIANVSHDLRTPLTSILGYSELLMQENLSPEGNQQIQRLRQKAAYMNDLVDSLFELTKVSSGASKSKMESLDLIRLLEQTIGLFDDQLTQAGLTVRRVYDCDAAPVVTDGTRIHQVFANLLGNAIKYALSGTRIYVEVRNTDTFYRVRLINTSSYEMDFQAEEILQRFARGDKARSTKGSGLGLAIAQTYTESVGGRFLVHVDGDQFSAILELPKTERIL